MRLPLFLNVFAKLAVMLSLFLSLACTGKVNGAFYYDKNQNSRMDKGEEAGQYVRFSVTKDGETFAEELISDKTGEYQFTGERGVFCIEVDKKTLSASPSETVAKNLPAESVAKQVSSFGGAESNNASSDSNANSTSSAQNESSTSSSNTSTSNSSSSSSNDTTDTAPVGENCIRKKAFGGSVTKDISLGYDLFGDISHMSAREPCELSPLQSCEVSVPYPCDCTLEDFFVPSEFLTVHSSADAGRFDADIGHFEVSLNASPEVIREGRAGKADICKSKFYFVVSRNAPPRTMRFDFQPKASCPDGTHDLKGIQIHVDATPEIRMSQQFDGDVDWGSRFDMSVSVKNQRRGKVQNCELSCDFPSKVDLVSSLPAADCDGGANPAICNCNLNTGEEEKTFHFNFRMPESNEFDGSTSFSFECKLEAKGLDAPLEESRLFRLVP